jgi:hypothetical protein
MKTVSKLVLCITNEYLLSIMLLGRECLQFLAAGLTILSLRNKLEQTMHMFNQADAGSTVRRMSL